MNKKYINPCDGKFPLVGSGLGLEYNSSKNPPFVSFGELTTEHALQICESGLNGETASLALGSKVENRYDHIQQTLDNAKEKGIKFFVSIGNIPSKTEDASVKLGVQLAWNSWLRTWKEIVTRFKDHPAVGGWHLCDEPSYAIFHMLGKCKEMIEEIDSNHPVWVNLFPDVTLCIQNGETCETLNVSSLKTLAGSIVYIKPGTENNSNPEYLTYDYIREISSYSKYIQKFIEIFKPSFLSYDFYPIRKYSGGYPMPEGFVDCRFYTHLEMYHNFSESSQCPFWNYPLVMPHNLYVYKCSDTNKIVQQTNGIYPMPTFAALCLQVFASLAYGVQGFCFWAFFQRLNPTVSKTCGNVTEQRVSQEYISAPISLPNPEHKSGEETEIFTMMYKIIDEVNYFSNIFLGCEVEEVRYAINDPVWNNMPTGNPSGTYYKIPPAMKSFEMGFAGIQQLMFNGLSNLMISKLHNGGDQYVVIVNTSILESVEVWLQFDKTHYHSTGEIRLSPGRRNCQEEPVENVSKDIINPGTENLKTKVYHGIINPGYFVIFKRLED